MVVIMNEMDAMDKFKRLLKELFRIDLQDLDFGIYKIMKIKQDAISNFIDKEIDTIIETAIKKFPDKDESLISQVFNLSYEFFSRYYDTGDFIPQIRYGGKDKYMIPYNGQEVEFYWPTRNAYYVKTTEYFNNYSFIVYDNFDPDNKYRVDFKIRRASLEKNYVVSKSKFFFLDDNPVEASPGRVTIYFNYRTMTEDEEKRYPAHENSRKNLLKEEAEENILQNVPDKLKDIFSYITGENNEERTILEKHLNMYFKKVESDYFIVKNLKSFLDSELDNFLKREVLNYGPEYKISEKDQYLAGTIKSICSNIINQISQIEDFERKLWEKLKFAYNVNYVITIDKIIEKDPSMELFKRIMESNGFNKQIEEWKSLEIVGDEFNKSKLFTQKLEAIVLTDEYKSLPLDTKYFKDIEFEILSLFMHLDSELDGVLVHSENYQALTTLLPQFKGEIQTIYIDPPFNTGKDFLFKDNYQDGSWLTLMLNRLELAEKFIKSDGSLYLHLDHISEHYGKLLLDNVFGYDNFRAKITWNTGDNISGFKTQAKNWIRQADFIHFYTKSPDFKFIKIFEMNKSEDTTNTYGWLDILGYDKEALFIEKWKNGDLIKEPVSECVKPKGTVWNDIYSFQYSEPRITESIGFVSNQKPENLLRRIIQSSTEKGDIVMDFFLGSGTTTAVAHKLNRKWVGVEMGEFFNEIYTDVVDVKDSKLLKKNKKSIIYNILKKKDSTVIAINKVGLLGRMKIVLAGDKEFYAIDSLQKRTPHPVHYLSA